MVLGMLKLWLIISVLRKSLSFCLRMQIWNPHSCDPHACFPSGTSSLHVTVLDVETATSPNDKLRKLDFDS